MGNKYFNNGSAAILGILYAMEMSLRQMGLDPNDARQLMKKMIHLSASDFLAKREESIKYSLEILVDTIGDDKEQQKYHDNPNNLDDIFATGGPLHEVEENPRQEDAQTDSKENTDTWDW